MSGIAGIFDRSGAPVDRAVFARLLSQLDFRGPDRKGEWVSGNLALGHTLLCTTFEAHGEHQPLCYDGKYWLVADARIDRRDELIWRLKGSGHSISRNPTDPDLIVQAYDLWGTDCTDHLIGDFAFAIWDRTRQRLFCARDHFGVKPFFYAESASAFLFSNSLNCLRRFPGISSELNRQVMLDFLLFGMNLDLETSAFDQIKRLPPAHQLCVDRSGLTTRMYWRLSPSADIRYRKGEEYLHHFDHLLKTAVDDRLRAPRIAIEMSGGLDSTSIAALAKSSLDQSGDSASLRAYTVVYDSLIPDIERRYSDIAAKHLGIDIRHIRGDQCDLLSGDRDPLCQTPEPLDNPYKSLMVEYGLDMSGFSRVCLSGQGADEILRAQTLVSLFGRSSLADIFAQIMVCLRFCRHRPPLGIRSLLSRSSNHKPTPELPEWIRPDRLKSFNGQERWERFWAPLLPAELALRADVLPRFLPRFYWSQYLEAADPEMQRVTVESRWPFLDTRLIQDLLAFPPLPWFWRKLILRESMRGKLPEIIRNRPKTPLRGFPYLELLKQGRIVWDGDVDQGSQLHQFVDMQRLDAVLHSMLNADSAAQVLRPMLLYNWMQSAY